MDPPDLQQLREKTYKKHESNIRNLPIPDGFRYILTAFHNNYFPAMFVVLFGDDICLHVCQISLHNDVTPIMKLHLPQSCYLQVLTEYHRENHSAMISIGCGGRVNCVDSSWLGLCSLPLFVMISRDFTCVPVDCRCLIGDAVRNYRTANHS